ncbi:Transcription factor, K-box [Dillenia turbinata]|uniref:Transcription factor, K-box n=1 Tax=Dillenia turbinata TaxID=194707 RepID=A0AAN8WCJ4_9MAGN
MGVHSLTFQCKLQNPTWRVLSYTIFNSKLHLHTQRPRRERERERSISSKAKYVHKIETLKGHIDFRRHLFSTLKSYWLLPLCQGSTSFGDVLLHTAAFWQMRTLIMQKITDRHRLYRSAEKNDQLDQPSLDLQILYIVHISVHRHIIMLVSKFNLKKSTNFEKYAIHRKGNSRLLQIRGEELKELSMEELKGLEQLVERGLNRVIVMKHEKIMNEISVLERKANVLGNAQARFAEQGQSCESAITNNCSATNAPSDPEVSDISLKLGRFNLVQIGMMIHARIHLGVFATLEGYVVICQATTFTRIKKAKKAKDARDILKQEFEGDAKGQSY